MDYRKFKIVLVGDKKVGKTMLVERMHNRPFKEDYQSTYGCYNKLFLKDDVILKIWDHGGL